MALPININDLINCRTVESERIEFKEDWNPEIILHTICAFANDINNWGGGYIIVGIKEDNGKPTFPITGLASEKIDSIQKELLSLCHKIKPTYFPVIDHVIFDEKDLLIIWVTGGQNRPYQAPVSLASHSHYAYYIRRFSNTIKAKQENERELIELAANIPFDDRMNQRAEVSDLKLALIQSFLQEIGSKLFEQSIEIPFYQLCDQMRIIDGPQEYLKPRNVGLMFFNDNPEKFFPISRIELVIFKTSPADDEMKEKFFTGPIHHQLRDALSYIKTNIIIESIIKIPNEEKAERYYNYPYEALEEALVNAIYHRSYDIREPVEIRIHPDRIEILSFPGPDRSVSLIDVEKGNIVSRRYRNRRIGEFLKELQLTEGKATGIPKIKKVMKRNGSPEPIFKTDDDRTYFLTVLLIHEKARVEAHDEAQVEAHDSLSETETEILKACNIRGNLSSTDIATMFGHISISGNLKKSLANLMKLHYLEFTLPDKPKSKNQKYRITETGKKYILNNKVNSLGIEHG